MITGCSARRTCRLTCSSWLCAISSRTERNCSTTSVTVSPIRRAAARSAGVQGSEVPSTSWCHWANERRGDSSAGSLPNTTGLNGLPPQVTVRTRSGRNQIRYSPGELESGVARIPLASPVIEAKAGASLARAEVAITGARGRVSSHSPISRSCGRARDLAGGEDLALEQQRRAAGAERLQQRLASGRTGRARQSPSRAIAWIMRCSSRRTVSSAWAWAKLSRAAIRVATVSASSSLTARIS